MATTYKILAAYNGGSAWGDWYTLYTVPSGKSAIISSLVAANTGLAGEQMGVQLTPALTGFPVKLVPADAAGMAQNSRVAFTEGWTIGEGDSIAVWDINGAVHYSIFGTEIG